LLVFWREVAEARLRVRSKRDLIKECTKFGMKTDLPEIRMKKILITID
jgi:hypothetical protein